MKKIYRFRDLCAIWLLGLVQLVQAQDLQPLFDVHVHYKWDQAEIISPQQALDLLDKAGVHKAVLIGTPADYALKLYRLAPERIIPVYGPYLVGGEKLTWQFRTELIDEVRRGLRSGIYRGIGELHLIGGMAVPWRDSKVFTALLALAHEYDVPLMIHSEYSSIKPTLSICQENPSNRFLLAHAGAVITPAQIMQILQACPNVVMDLSARDPWRYVNNPITDETGLLLPQWRKLFLDYSERFMIGSDPVWPVDKGFGWDEPDSGWNQLQRYLSFHRRWLDNLPSDIAKKILWTNAERWFAL
jgi:predicted TIM-barrel fold metal-dependent hydrolase